LNPTKQPMAADIPNARMKKRPKISLLWLVPVIAAAVACWLVFESLKKIGPAITIQFNDGNGLAANQTVVRYRGVQVGSVQSVQLTPDARHVEVHARLDRSAADLAREDSIFWIVRPELSAGGLHGLETIVSGLTSRCNPEKKPAKGKKILSAQKKRPFPHRLEGEPNLFCNLPAQARLLKTRRFITGELKLAQLSIWALVPIQPW
jgi:paraquat-inducible protein B